MRSQTLAAIVPAFRRDVRTWPKVRRDTLSEEDKSRFDRNRKAIAAVLEGATYAAIEAETGYDADRVRRLLRRCVLPDGAGDILGERGLVGGVRATSYHRTARITRTVQAGRGYCAGALGALFEAYPEIEEDLIKTVLKQVPGGKKLYEVKIAWAGLQRHFLELCERLGRRERGEWPFNTHSLGRSAIRLFVRRLSVQHAEAFIHARYGDDAATMLHVGTGERSALLPQIPFDIAGLDELRYDGIGTVVLDVPGGGEQEVACERIGIILYVEGTAKPILSWYAYYGKEVAASDIRAALQAGLTPPAPWTFTLPVSYGNADAGYPHALLPALRYHPPAVLLLDNFSTHQDMTLLSDIGERLGSFVVLGGVGGWYQRAFLEAKVGQFLTNSAHRLPGTTGSQPDDPRRQDAVGTAVAYRIRWAELLQLIEVTVAQMNATPSEGIGFLTPNQLLGQLVADPTRGFSPRPLPRVHQHETCIKLEWVTRTVRGSQSKGRRPSIKVDRVRYTNDKLAHAWELVGKTVAIGIDADDMRTVRAAVADNGADLGVLQAEGGWGRTQHTRRQRQAINRLLDQKVLTLLDNADPIPVFLDYLRERSLTESRAHTQAPKVSRAATQLAGAQAITGQRPPAPGMASPDPLDALRVPDAAPALNEVPLVDVRQLLRGGTQWTRHSRP